MKQVKRFPHDNTWRKKIRGRGARMKTSGTWRFKGKIRGEAHKGNIKVKGEQGEDRVMDAIEERLKINGWGWG